MFPQIQWVVISLGLAAIEVSFLYKLIFTGQPATSLTDLIAICFIGSLFVLSSVVDHFKSLSLTKEGFKFDLDRIQERITENEKKINENYRQIGKLLLMSMGPETYENLKKLADGTLLNYTKEHHHGLETELYHLRNLGYVRLKSGTATSIFDIPVTGPPEISHYIEVTREGHEYLRLREEHEKEVLALRA